ncbi:hypothetical protein AUP07_0252 [methanogenic archaeon mixed culture ISO4-G1]|nr:hypothetical protein AUP07_0252 [methanogenic archaeon mixed culture ISO4-G1]
MGFLDKVKSSVGDMGKAVNNAIDNQKLDMKIREEQRNLEEISKEIGGIVAEAILSGQGFDETMIAEQYSKYIETKQRIEDLQAERGDKDPDSEPEEVVIEQPQEEDVPVIAAPSKEVQIEIPKEEPVQKKPDVPEPSVEAEGASVWNETDTSGWVEVKDEVFWTEPEPAVQEEASTAEPAPVQEASAEDNERRIEEPDDDSPLSRIKSYRSQNYSGGKL